MKYHLALASGRWIGGMTCRRDTLHEQLDALREIATAWKEPVVATRLGKHGRRKPEVHRIEPQAHP